MSYPKNMKLNDCGIKYVNGIYRKQINKKSKTHCYIKFTKITNKDAKDDEKQNADKKIKIQVIQDCKTGEFSIETSDNIQLYKATSNGKWSIVNGQRPVPQFLPYYVITQFFPSLENSNNKKSKRNKKKNKNPNNYNDNNDNNNFIHPSFKLCQHYKPDSRVVGGFVLFYKDVFSQWFSSKMIINNISYANCEQYMMAEKAKLFNDNEYYNLILKTDDPRKCKKLGRGVRNFKESIWKQHRQEIVYKANLAKFAQNEILKEKLLSYDHKLCFAEASSVDKIWGIGLKVTDPAAGYRRNWRGLNLLGKAVTKVRDEILKQ